MATKGYSFQDDEKTVIDIDTDMGRCCRKREKWMNEKNVLVFLSWNIFFWKI